MDERGTILWNERQPGVFEPDVVLPAQFFRTLRGNASLAGERRLILAVLEDAVNCFQKNLFARDNRSRRLFREAERWMMSSDRALPFSFENICEFLSIDAEYIRQGLHRWARAAESQAARRFAADSSGARRAVTAPIGAGTTRVAAPPLRDRVSLERSLRSVAL